MGDSVKVILGGDIRMPVEPVGTLAANGWLPGTFTKYTTTPTSFSGAMATVDISDGTGVIAGFLVTGPQHKQPVEELSDMWTTDTRQRDGGSVAADWTGFDAGASFYFDNYNQLQRMGSRIISMCLCPAEGIFKFYVFEIVNKAERTTPGTGAILVYTPGSKLYVSNRGRLTSEKELPTSVWTGYILANTGSDIEGNYLTIARGQSL